MRDGTRREEARVRFGREGPPCRKKPDTSLAVSLSASSAHIRLWSSATVLKMPSIHASSGSWSHRSTLNHEWRWPRVRWHASTKSGSGALGQLASFSSDGSELVFLVRVRNRVRLIFRVRVRVRVRVRLGLTPPRSDREDGRDGEGVALQELSHNALGLLDLKSPRPYLEVAAHRGIVRSPRSCTDRTCLAG